MLTHATLMYLLAAAGVVGGVGTIAPMVLGWTRTNPWIRAAASYGFGASAAAVTAGLAPAAFMTDGGYFVLILCGAALGSLVLACLPSSPRVVASPTGTAEAMAFAVEEMTLRAENAVADAGVEVLDGAAVLAGKAKSRLVHYFERPTFESKAAAVKAGGTAANPLFAPFRVEGKDGCRLEVAIAAADDGNATVKVEAFGHSRNVFKRRIEEPKLDKSGVKWTVVNHGGQHRTITATVPVAKLQSVRDLLNTIK